jgi:dTDP-4-amino-4,6-dideoxygalactose transaminase
MEEIKFNVPLKIPESTRNVKNFLHSGKPLHGPGINILKIKKEVKNKFGFKNIHLTNSCTSALEICSLALNLKSSDEVLLPSFTFITTASSFARTGCRLKYFDIEKSNLMPSFSSIKSKITNKTKVIIIVHYQGYSVDYLDKLHEYCKKKKIFLIEDAAQAFGSYFKKKPLGSFGDFACFSFHETKNIHSGTGGMLVINNKKFIDKINYIFDKGTDRNLMQMNKVKYYTWVEIGSAFLMSEFSASYLLPQIKKYKKIFTERSKLYLRYVDNFKNSDNKNFTLTNNYKYKYNFHAFVIILEKNIRDSFLKYLKKFKINAVISYMPLHKSKIGKNYHNKKNKLKNTEEYLKKIVRLPLHNSLSLNEVNYISKIIKKYFNN